MAPQRDTYGAALQLARASFLNSVSDSTPGRTGAEIHGRGALALRFLGDTYRVRLEDGTVTNGNGADVETVRAILLLHYLAQADGTPPGGDWVRFGSLDGGRAYERAFAERTEGAFLNICLSCHDRWQAGAIALGGAAAGPGDASVSLTPLPRTPVLLAFWGGDDELPSAARILLDAAINHYLPTEDVAVMCDLLLDKLQESI